MNKLIGFALGFFILPYVAGSFWLLVYLAGKLNVEETHLMPGIFACIALTVLAFVVLWMLEKS